MSASIFISHAGENSDQAREVAGLLSEAGLEAKLDRHELGPGDSFLNFMESGLSDCDYCLLLWSEAASRRGWVRAEWEAAFYRSVTEARAFLVVGRLEEYKLPALLAPRLMIDFFPEAQPGMGVLIKTWRDDRTAEGASQRPVSPPLVRVEDDERGETLYVSSELFGRTLPIRLALDTPTGVHVERVVSAMGLPRQFDYQGRIGFRLNYKLAMGERSLFNHLSLDAQGVRPKNLLWLEVEMSPFAATTPISGDLTPVAFRSGADEGLDLDELLNLARDDVKAAASRAGMGL